MWKDSPYKTQRSPSFSLSPPHLFPFPISLIPCPVSPSHSSPPSLTSLSHPHSLVMTSREELRDRVSSMDEPGHQAVDKITTTFHYTTSTSSSSPADPNTLSPLPVAHVHPFTSWSVSTGSTIGFSRLRMSHLSLLVLVLHNSILVLLLRASRSHSDHSSNPSDSPSLLYLASVAVVFTELLKLSICFLVLIFSMLSSSSSVPIRQGLACILSSVFQPREIIRLSLPSACYALQNNLLYLALSNLEAATFQVVYQLKILATALFSILLLRRTLSVKQWSSLLLLMMGVTLVQWQTAVPHHPSPGNSSEEPEEKPILGFMAVILACLSSGFAGCYFERILKSSSTYALVSNEAEKDGPSLSTSSQPISPPSLWVRNGQLGISATFFSLLLMILTDGPMIRDHGLLQGFGPLPWIVVLNQALGGLLVAAVVKYADNILKGFATSLSILLSGLISYLFLGFHPTLPFLFGASLVLLSTFLYGRRA